jgi:hypothetical protein
MSIINALLTGGILIGKICQALGGSDSKVYFDEASGLTVVGAVSAGGVKFYRTVFPNGQSGVYAFNPDTTSPVMVTVPNDANQSGITYIIQPTEKLAFGEADSPLVSPLTNVLAGQILVPSSSDAGPNPSLFKLAFRGLNAHGYVNVGSFSLSCTTTQLSIVTTALTATAINYLQLRSDKGVSVTNQKPISPEPPSKTTAGVDITQIFDIDFASLGFDMEKDTIDGEITLEASPSKEKLAMLSKLPSEPLHPAEQKFFELLSQGKL